jgi:hypothetical protein
VTTPELPNYRTGAMVCPGCGTRLDAHLSTQPGCAAPAPDDATVCAYCSTVAIYTTTGGQLALRRPTDAELDELLADPEITRAIHAVKQQREGTYR